jgi:hypothetical protein
MAIGLIVLTTGGALAAFSTGAIAHPAPDLRIIALPAGLVFVFAGALIVTALAVVFDWVAFGPGEHRFSGSLGVPCMAVSGATGKLAGRLFFGLFAVLFDLAALGLWIQYVRLFFRAKAPLDHG